jgi:nitric oxide reductase activation protein
VLDSQELPDQAEAYRPLTLPFGRCLRPDFHHSTQQPYEQLAVKIKRRLQAHGLKVYKADIRQHLLKNDGRIALEDLEALIVQPPAAVADAGPCPAPDALDLSWLDLSDLAGCEDVTDIALTNPNGTTFRYAEWDCRLADYLDDHVQVIERPVTPMANDFYEQTLQRHWGLVKQIHRAFELLKPEGFKVLRQWLEGDDFDYRALLDYAVERKAGRMPSERLYIKRVKAQRDVAALFLVDLSRSTANRAYGTRSRVIDIEKEAIVLLCEALEIVGDAYAIAGFSGSGRLGVDYYRIKEFEDPLDDAVRGRIHAMAPHRSTRMGAAIRHATGLLLKMTAKVRLLIVLGDGFPNDVDYKKKYAIEDTSKAIYEARAKHVHVKGITVNITGDARLDTVYGNFHHSVISDVRELPDKLLRIYGTLTRM